MEKKNKKEGVTQLKDYLSFSRASLGIWFNGEDISFWNKVETTKSTAMDKIIKDEIKIDFSIKTKPEFILVE